jgi:uncharacterized membrane protein YbhN (UPF0104 family)
MSRPTGWKRALPAAKRLLGIAFAALVLGLLYVQAREIDWGEVASSVAEVPAGVLAAAGAFAVASYAVYACFEWLARRYTGHDVAVPSVLTIAFVSYAFSLNLGSLVGGGGLRLRLYTRLGLEPGVVARIWMFCVLTNWLGYVLIGGVLFTAGLVSPPAELGIGADALRLVGVGSLLVAAGYLALCGLSRKRTWTIRGQTLVLPSLRLALGQCALSIVNWMLIAAVVHALLQFRVDYAQVLGTLMVSAVAGSIAHVPGAVGVLETVFVTLLGDQVAKPELLAALLLYRFVYYLAPLAIAGVLYFYLEWRVRRAAGVAPAIASSGPG